MDCPGLAKLPVALVAGPIGSSLGIVASTGGNTDDNPGASVNPTGKVNMGVLVCLVVGFCVCVGRNKQVAHTQL